MNGKRLIETEVVFAFTAGLGANYLELIIEYFKSANHAMIHTKILPLEYPLEIDIDY